MFFERSKNIFILPTVFKLILLLSSNKAINVLRQNYDYSYFLKLFLFIIKRTVQKNWKDYKNLKNSKRFPILLYKVVGFVMSEA